MKKILLFGALICAGQMYGMEPIEQMGMETISPEQMQDKNQVHRELLGKIKKLEGYDDIYVGAGYSAAGEPMFFAMEKLDDERAKIWSAHADTLYLKIIDKLNE